MQLKDTPGTNVFANYTLDGNNLRVRKQVTGGTARVYVFSGTKVIAEYDNGAPVGSPTREYIYSGSTLVAKIEGGAATYHHQDHLSTRVTTDTSGNVARTFGHYPFGETWYETGTANKWKFTSYERDSESGNDYAMMRASISRLGRFSSPDPIAGSITNPQSLNRYAYARNDPINLVDPLGTYPEDGTHVVCLLDQNANCQRAFSFGGLSPYILEEMARHDSIIRTGYDPAFGRFRGEIEIQTCRDGVCYSVTLDKPTLEQYGAYLNAAILWAAGPAGFAQAQFPQLAGAGAGGAVVTLQVIVAGGAVLVSTPVLVTAGVVVAVAATAYLGYRAYLYFSEQSRLKAVAKEFGIENWRELGKAVEAYKRSVGMRPSDNLSMDQLRDLAAELPLDCGKARDDRLHHRP